MIQAELGERDDDFLQLAGLAEELDAAAAAVGDRGTKGSATRQVAVLERSNQLEQRKNRIAVSCE